MLDSPRAPRVREAARLQQRAARSQTGLFLLEGPSALDEAVRWQPQHLVEVFATDAARERHAALLGAASAHAPVTAVSERALAAIADTVRPQGIVAVAKQAPVSLDAAIARAAAAPHPLVAILHEVRDPGNLGTILRAADAAGASAVVVTANSVDPYSPKVVRSTTGSLFHVDLAVGASTADAVGAARAAGLQVLAADVSGEELTAIQAEGALAAGTAWLFGNEARGLDAATLALADRTARLPVYGEAESLNLATAASVCLYQSAFAQRA
ncbi:TrmH family RNA methyltransferase [Agrococcus carbonis]|uniref:RNA methyltransferase, TrmH family n=1 Tax=Agrococcus carbonis TaxID=684552 RepID=A0A1H1SLE8_9MICO|nr:RNA methyltransferase [Agrococcus carbonis]SDS48663.1 RNA methyltransferase, TrmH family [Agrococcus carbonis]